MSGTAPAAPSEGTAHAGLARLRATGWAVAVHNDYRQSGVPMTFWLFTHPSGGWVKGEGQTDEVALAACEAAAAERARAGAALDGVLAAAMTDVAGISAAGAGAGDPWVAAALRRLDVHLKTVRVGLAELGYRPAGPVPASPPTAGSDSSG